MLVVANVLVRRSLDVWRAVAQTDVDLHLVGSTRDFGNPIYPPGQRATYLTDIDLHVLEPKGWRRRGHLWWVYPGLRKLSQELGPDVLHVLSEPWGLPVIQALTLGRPVVAHGSSTRYDTGPSVERAIRRRVLSATLPRLAGFAGATPAAIAQAKRFGLPPSTPSVVAQHLVPDPERMWVAAQDIEDTARPEDDGSPTVAYVGRMEPEKGLEDLIQALATMSRPVRLEAVGAGSDEKRLRRLAEDTGVRVQWAGQLDPAEALRVITRADVLVVPSRATPDWEEYFGRVALEAMILGTAVVVTSSGFLPDLVGETGTVVEAGGVRQLARDLEDLLDDPERRADQALRAARRARAEFAPAVIAERLRGLWQAMGTGDR